MVEQLIESSVYAGVFLVLVACGLGLPLPEDVPLILGGVMAGRGQADVFWVFVVSMLGVLAGDSAIYFAGRRVGPDSRIFKTFLSPERKKKVQAYFQRWGNWIVFFARFFAGIRAPCYFAAGVFGVKYWVFLLLDFIAALVSVPLWIWLGHYIAANYKEMMEKIEAAKGWVMLVVGILAALLIAWWLWRRYRRKAAPLAVLAGAGGPALVDPTAVAAADGDRDGSPKPAANPATTPAGESELPADAAAAEAAGPASLRAAVTISATHDAGGSPGADPPGNGA
jgi:membrane protein DedA with SNARE-associated domain